jgi:hypothetical protein
MVEPIDFINDEVIIHDKNIINLFSKNKELLVFFTINDYDFYVYPDKLYFRGNIYNCINVENKLVFLKSFYISNDIIKNLKDFNITDKLKNMIIEDIVIREIIKK